MTAQKDDGSKPKDTPADKAAVPKTGSAPGSATSGASSFGPASSTTAKPGDTPASAGASPSKPATPVPPGSPPQSAKSTGPTETTKSSNEAGKPAQAAPPPSGSQPKEAGSKPSASPVPPIGGAKPAAPSDPLKGAATGSSAIPPNAASKEPGSKDSGAPKPSEPAKPGPVGSSAIKPGSTGGATSGPGQTGSKPEPGAQSASRVDPKDSVGDGPIIDLKAKRVAEPAQSKTTAATSESRKSGGAGFGTVAASGLVGGVVGAGLLFALSQSGILARDTSRLDALDRTVATLPTREALAAVEKRASANEQALKPLTERVEAASARADEALKKAESVPPPQAPSGDAPAAPAAPPSDLVARLDALDQRVSALQEEPGREQPAGSTLSKPNVESSTIDALRRDIDERAKADQALAEKVEGLQQAVDQRVKAATDAVQAATDANRKAIEAGRTQIEEASKSADRRLQEQSERIAALGKTVDSSAKSATVEAALRIVAADRIATALADGSPYSNALTSLRNTQGGDVGVLGPLEPFAETGAPTAASLAAAFRPIRDKVVAAQRAAKARTVAESGSITDRLQSMASSIVQVRRVGEPGGAESLVEDDPTSKVQDALDQGRVGEAARAFSALPDDVKAQAGDFGKALKARADADAAAQALQADAFKSLSTGR